MDSIVAKSGRGRVGGRDPGKDGPTFSQSRQQAEEAQASQPLTDHLPHIFAVSAGLMGVSLSGIGLFAILTQIRSTASLGEELLAFNASMFGGSCVAAFLGMRNHVPRWKRLCDLSAEGLLLAGLVLMAIVCICLAFSLP